MREKRRSFTTPPPHPVQSCSSLVSQYHDTFMNLPKTDDNDRTHKKIQIPYLHMWSLLFPGQVSHRSNSSQLFWNLENPVLVQSMYYRRKITYHLLLTGFFHKLILVQDVGHNMLHLHAAPKMPSLHVPVSYLSCQWQGYAELNRHVPFGIDLNKILPDLLKLRTKAEKLGIQFPQNT